MKYCVLNERGKFCAKIFSHYTDILIFVLGHFIVTHPVERSCRRNFATRRPVQRYRRRPRIRLPFLENNIFAAMPLSAELLWP